MLTVARARRWIAQQLRWQDRLAELERGVPPLRLVRRPAALAPYRPRPIPRRRSA